MPITINGSGSITGGGLLTQGTAVASTSGTSINFTGIPSWVKRVTVMFNGVSTNGASNPIIQLGISSGPVTSGYTAYYYAAGFSAGTTTTTGFLFGSGFAGNLVYGHLFLTNVSGNVWVSSTNVALFDGSNRTGQNGGGTVTLSGTLDRVRITTANGTDTFDAGSVNIMYE